MTPKTGPVVVVGAGGALGSQVCRLLVAAGHEVVAADVSSSGLSELAGSLGGDGGADLRTVVMDATSPTEVAATFGRLGERHGGLAGLVNAQGVAGRGGIGDVSTDQWEHVLRVNLSSVFYCCRAALPWLVASGGGVIVNVASVAGLREQPGSLAYASSKAGVVMLTRTLAADLAGDAVRVHAVCPTAIDSPMVRGTVPTDELASYAAQQPMGRMLAVHEVARVIADLVLTPLPYTPEPLVV